MKTRFVAFNSLQRYLGVSVFFIIGLLLLGLPGCGEPATSQIQVSEEDLSTPSMNTASTVKVDLLYFHLSQRCTKCLCFEKHISYVVSEYFQDEIDSGQLTFQILNLEDKENYALAQKYGAVGSQLFTNTRINGQEYINNIQDIWVWNCTGNTDRFDMEVKNCIELCLAGVQ